MFDNLPHSFKTQYRCYSVSMMAGNEREDVEKGGKICVSSVDFEQVNVDRVLMGTIPELPPSKEEFLKSKPIILPPSALELLTRLNIVYPMLFKLTNARQKRSTHCGVLEFVADEGKAYIPHWMMRNLFLSEGDLVNIESATLPVATYAKFQPQTVDFLDITDPKAVLENLLRSFACLTKGDMLAIKYNNKIYELLVLETKPQDAVSIIECDMQVDFARPVGYVEPERPSKKQDQVDAAVPSDPIRGEVRLWVVQNERCGFFSKQPSLDNVPEEYINRGPQLFPGKGTRLDGKKKKTRENIDDVNIKPTIIKRGVPDMKFKVGELTFIRKVLKPAEDVVDIKKEFTPFEGHGKALRKKR